MLQEIFFPFLFFGRSNPFPPVVGALSTLPVKKSGKGQQKPVTSSEDKYTSLLHASYGLIGAVRGKRGFPTDDHIQAVKEKHRDEKNWDYVNDAKPLVIVSNQSAFKKHLFLRAKYTGS